MQGIFGMRGVNQLDQIGTETVEEMLPDGFRKITKVPVYVCGHCQQSIGIRPERKRPRTTCRGCGSIICELTELCRTHCTPTFELDGWDESQKSSERFKFLRPILAGCTTQAAAEQWLAENKEAR